MKEFPDPADVLLGKPLTIAERGLGAAKGIIIALPLAALFWASVALVVCHYPKKFPAPPAQKPQSPAPGQPSR